MAGASVKLLGAKGLEKALRELGPKVGRKVLRQALKKGGDPILADAKANAPVKTGLLRDSLKVRAGKRVKKGRVTRTVQTKEGDFKGQTYYSAFHEYGTSKMRARPFMRPAWDRNKARSLNVVMDEIRAGVEREAKSAAGGNP